MTKQERPDRIADDYQELISGSIDELNSSGEFLGTELSKNLDEKIRSELTLRHPLIILMLVVLTISVAGNFYYYLKGFEETSTTSQADGLLEQDLAISGVDTEVRQIFMELVNELDSSAEIDRVLVESMIAEIVSLSGEELDEVSQTEKNSEIYP
jgi:hypothetical protein